MMLTYLQEVASVVKAKEKRCQSVPHQLVSLQRDTISAIEKLIAVQSSLNTSSQERLAVEKERLAIDRERLAVERERLALERSRHDTDKARCVIVPADGGTWVYQAAITGTLMAEHEC
jgi:hypothetical protein